MSLAAKTNTIHVKEFTPANVGYPHGGTCCGARFAPFLRRFAVGHPLLLPLFMKILHPLMFRANQHNLCGIVETSKSELHIGT